MKKDTMKYLLISLRPKQWVKNFLVIAPLFFSKRMMDVSVIVRVALAFILFCMFSSSIYLLNDVLDKERDKRHPKKSKRPVARGLVSLKVCLVSSFLLLLLSVAGSFFLGESFLFIGLAYWSINLLYSLYLKQLVIIDVMCIAIGFVLRVMAGGIAVGVPSSHWMLTTIIFLSLFLAFTKRKGELALFLKAENGVSRPVLKNYNMQILDQFLVISATSSMMSYALFTLSDYATIRFGSKNLVYTIPFVIFGIFRYFYLINFSNNDNENPVEMVFGDSLLVINILLWIIASVFIIYS
jgi:4-hydroxybenzoate polyprenyltransferase